MGALCGQSKTPGLARTLQKAYPSSLATSFCSSDCPCRATSAGFPATAEYASAVFNQTGGAISVSQCPKSLFGSDAPTAAATGFMGKLEKRFRCSGLCAREKWFYFSDVAMGQPLYACQGKISNYISGTFWSRRGS